MLAQILGIDPATLDPRSDVFDGRRLLTIRAGDPWSWERRTRDRGIRGSITVGDGAIDIMALGSASGLLGEKLVSTRKQPRERVAGESR